MALDSSDMRLWQCVCGWAWQCVVQWTLALHVIDFWLRLGIQVEALQRLYKGDKRNYRWGGRQPLRRRRGDVHGDLTAVVLRLDWDGKHIITAEQVQAVMAWCICVSPVMAWCVSASVMEGEIKSLCLL